MLVVDPDVAGMDELAKNLQNQGYEIDWAQGVDEAMRLLQSREFDLVLTDDQLSDISGLDLLKWIKENHKIPVVVTSGDKHVTDSLKSEGLGIDGFLEKPFLFDDLLRVLEGCFHSCEYPEIKEDNLDHDYCQLSIDELVLGKKLKFDLYFRIRPMKFVKISHRGEEIGKTQANEYKQKNTRYLYAKKEDYIKFIELKLEVGEKGIQAKRLLERKQIEFIKNTTEATIQSLFRSDIAHDDYVYAGVFLMNSVNLLSSDSAALNVLISLSKKSEFLYAHSVGVGLYSILIARAMKIQDPPTLFRVAVGGLLHDIGKNSLPSELLVKKTSELTAAEKEIMDRHPTEGAKLLTQLEFIPSEVVLILHQHHENAHGTGYPSQLSQDKIHPSARIVSLANEFCNLTTKSPNSDGLEPKEAIAQLLLGAPGLNPENFELEPREALKRVFIVDPLGDLGDRSLSANGRSNATTQKGSSAYFRYVKSRF